MGEDPQNESVSERRKKSNAIRLRARYGNLNELTKWRNARQQVRRVYIRVTTKLADR
jgi:hypothetical protein